MRLCGDICVSDMAPRTVGLRRLRRGRDGSSCKLAQAVENDITGQRGSQKQDSTGGRQIYGTASSVASPAAPRQACPEERQASARHPSVKTGVLGVKCCPSNSSVLLVSHLVNSSLTCSRALHVRGNCLRTGGVRAPAASAAWLCSSAWHSPQALRACGKRLRAHHICR